MSNFSPPVTFENLWIWATRASTPSLPATEGTPLTSDFIALTVHIKNLDSKRVKGRLAFSWTLADVQYSPTVSTFDLDLGEEAETPTLFRFDRAGYADFRVHLYIARVGAGVESNLLYTEEDFGRLAAGTRSDRYTLFSASVKDRSEWTDEVGWRKEQRKRTFWLILLTLAILIIASATLVVTLLHP